MTTRRDFLRQSASAMAASIILPRSLRSHTFVAPSVGASDQLNVALVGCRGMGWSDLRDIMNHPGMNCVALCDVDRSVLDRRAADAEKNWGRRPQLFGDYRRLLEMKDLDIVVIGTPDHWHCKILIDACQAGKDVYVEKPLANSIGECDAMVAAAERYGRIVQVGQQQRSAQLWHSMKRYIDSGQLGTIACVNVWANFNYGALRNPAPDGPVPEGVDYDMWLGPAPERPFNPRRFHGTWRMFWDYGGGVMSDWGVHLIDMALWGMNVTTVPQRVIASGGSHAFPDDFGETFNTLQAVYELPHCQIRWSNVTIESGPFGRAYGVEFKGTKGSLVANRESWEVIPQDGQLEPVVTKPTNNDHFDHTTNFLDCVRRRDPQTACTIQNAALCAKYTHMANIAARTRQSLTYDAAKRTFHNREADRLLMPSYRKPWRL